MILRCSCTYPMQDQLHGRGMRVHNAFKDKRGELSYRCTVCLKERKPGGDVAEKKTDEKQQTKQKRRTK